MRNIIKFAAAFIGVTVLIVFIVCQHYRESDLTATNARLRVEIARLNDTKETKNNLESQLDRAQSVNRSQQRDLLRLREQVSTLRAQLAQTTKQALEAPSPAVEKPEANVSPEEHYKQDIIKRTAFAVDWMRAFQEYATENQGRFPTNFDMAAPFLSDENMGRTNVATNEFEIVYQGSRNDLTNQNDGDLIVLRERQLRHRYDGKWGRVYGLADGSSLQRFFATEDELAQWEQDHLRNTASP